MTIYLKLANEGDLPLILSWRSSPILFSGFYTQTKPLDWEEHLNFWRSRNKDARQFMIVLVEDMIERDVGVVRIQQLDYWEPEIGILIGEVSLWGRGYAKEALNQALDWLRRKGYKYSRTTILDNNKRSIALFKSVGYHRIAGARLDESLYRKEL